MQPTTPENDFVEYLERRYVTSSSLGKRKTVDPPQAVSMFGTSFSSPTEQAVHPITKMRYPLEVLALARRPEPTTAMPCSSSSSTAQAIHPMTKTRLPRPEKPIRIPDSKRLMLGSEWIDAPLPSVFPEQGKFTRPSKGELRRTELEQWSKWAKKKEKVRQTNRDYAPGQWVQIRRGVYKGDPGQVFKPQMRERSDEEMEKERQVAVEALARGKSRHPNRQKWSWKGTGARHFARRVFRPIEYGLQIPEQNRPFAGFELDGRIFSHGLVLKLYKLKGLQPISAVDALTVAAFQEHPFSKRFPFPLPQDWEFRNGEQVEVAHREGHEHGRGVLRLSGAELCVEFVKDGVPALYPVTKEQLSKVIEIGDYVDVISGDKARREGLVVERREDILGISENGTRRCINFFAHVNCVTRTSRGDTSSIPWLEKEVVIAKGPHTGLVGIVKDVKQKQNRNVLFLWLFLPHLRKAVEVEDNRVVTKK
ncbi:hypothetical protein V5O48_017108 [Marasmius crinis-equi]|uniref:KOW domain-containing protein n=1 Tax=Marasmius crinis-equi TaxID=585013 RepID=A0ABR3EPW0_9AGAR